MRTIPEKETLTIEFKSDRSGYSDADLVDEIVGMANTQRCSGYPQSDPRYQVHARQYGHDHLPRSG